MTLHPSLQHAAGLIGTWSGSGRGEYPTIDTFEYVETVSFTHVGKPFLGYTQRTRRLLGDGTPGEPLHAESGYWRFPTPDTVEIVLAHPTGIAELQEGTVTSSASGLVIDVRSSTVAGTATAKVVRGVERRFELAENTFSYRIAMAAVGQPLQHHLACTLARAAS